MLLAGATSLPELATDVSAVRMHAPNLAAGDLFGSSLANMLILAVIDQLSRQGSVLRGAAIENALIACLAIVLNALGALFVLTQSRTTLLGVSPESVLLLLVYLAGTRAVYRNGVKTCGAAGFSDAAAKKRGRPQPQATVAATFAAAAAADPGRLTGVGMVGQAYRGGQRPRQHFRRHLAVGPLPPLCRSS